MNAAMMFWSGKKSSCNETVSTMLPACTLGRHPRYYFGFAGYWSCCSRLTDWRGGER